jgi:hypothetical protein
MNTVGSHGSFLWKALVFMSIKTGELIFPKTAPLIVPDQKVTTGALNAVVTTVVECVGMLPGADGGVYLQALRRSIQ